MGSFRVLPDRPDYLLQSPDSIDTPFAEVLRRYNGFEPARSWMDLHPWMELRIENAYYKAGAPKRGLDSFLGTEIAHYQVRPQGGLRQLSVQSMKVRPVDQPPVQQLIGGPQRRYRYYRFYSAIVFKRNGRTSGSVLLGANSTAGLERLAAQLLAEPASVCGDKSAHCTAFPESCSVSVEMEIVVNGAPRTVMWGSRVGSVAIHPRRVELLRPYAGRPTPVEMDPSDPNAFRLPLLPGDRITWE
ncbi:MAG: hypothetical protein WAM39_26400 [Bryobacteraceae bacterium]